MQRVHNVVIDQIVPHHFGFQSSPDTPYFGSIHCTYLYLYLSIGVQSVWRRIACWKHNYVKCRLARGPGGTFFLEPSKQYGRLWDSVRTGSSNLLNYACASHTHTSSLAFVALHSQWNLTFLSYFFTRIFSEVFKNTFFVFVSYAFGKMVCTEKLRNILCFKVPFRSWYRTRHTQSFVLTLCSQACLKTSNISSRIESKGNETDRSKCIFEGNEPGLIVWTGNNRFLRFTSVNNGEVCAPSMYALLSN